jgi:hypothetical protein
MPKPKKPSVGSRAENRTHARPTIAAISDCVVGSAQARGPTHASRIRPSLPIRYVVGNPGTPRADADHCWSPSTSTAKPNSSRRKYSLTRFRSPSTLIASNCKPLGPSLRCNASRSAISLRQGAHQVAQKLISSGRPKYSWLWCRLPSGAGSVNEGNAVPFQGRLLASRPQPPSPSPVKPAQPAINRQSSRLDALNSSVVPATFLEVKTALMMLRDNRCVAKILKADKYIPGVGKSSLRSVPDTSMASGM